MNAKDEKFSEQMIAARRAMDKHRDALSALAGHEISPELQQKMGAARERLQKYRAASRAEESKDLQVHRGITTAQDRTKGGL